MKISVILCTFNRCQPLEAVLNSLSASILPASVDWEVLVVDNNSTDRTRDVVAEISGKFPGRFRYLFEARPGKSFALNTGTRNAHGDVFAFVDDDVTVDTTWLQNLTAVLHDEKWAGTGGRTLPAHDYVSPPWMSLDMAGALYAHFDLGDAPRTLDRPPYGANMAFRKTIFEKYGGFRTDMGPSPDREIPRPNEDTEFGRRLMAAGERLRYEPSAVVRHPVPLERLNKEYFLTWWFDYGRAMKREIGARRDVYWGIPRRYFSMLKYGLLPIPMNAVRWLFTFNPQRRFCRKCWLWMRAGEFAELYRIRSVSTE
ncbi:MAG: glycosyltransferase family 2 protein [Candidatus Acidiferrales bacterium]